MVTVQNSPLLAPPRPAVQVCALPLWAPRQQRVHWLRLQATHPTYLYPEKATKSIAVKSVLTVTR